ncbi:MAG: F0F1 ATP synthase subunit A [Alphaproteobacteria bacterium]
MADPIHQFVITPIIPLEIGGINISYTNSALWMTFAVIASIVMLTLSIRPKAMVPGRFQVFGETLYQFVAGMIRENLGVRGMEYFPFVFTIFMLVLMGNMLGMIPGSFTFTSHLVVTAALAIMIFFTVLIIGVFRHGTHFLHLFLPPGLPVWLFPLIIPIEVVSFLVRPVTLSVRLFANMMAGHLVLKVFAGFSVAMLAAFGTAGFFMGLVPALFNVALITLEVLIAFLQAYVFTVLTCIYLKDTIEIGH